MDCSPPGSFVHGILQARILEWVAISFSNAWKWKVKVKSLSHVWLLATPWTAAYQAPPPMWFSRQEYWSGVPLPSPRIVVYNNQNLKKNKNKNKKPWLRNGKRSCIDIFLKINKWPVNTLLGEKNQKVTQNRKCQCRYREIRTLKKFCINASRSVSVLTTSVATVCCIVSNKNMSGPGMEQNMHTTHSNRYSNKERGSKEGSISWTAKLLTLTVSQGNRNKGKNKQMGPNQTYKHLFAQQRKPKTKWREHTNWKQISGNDAIDKGLISKIYKQQYNSITKKQPMHWEKGQKT